MIPRVGGARSGPGEERGGEKIKRRVRHGFIFVGIGERETFIRVFFLKKIRADDNPSHLYWFISFPHLPPYIPHQVFQPAHLLRTNPRPTNLPFLASPPLALAGYDLPNPLLQILPSFLSFAFPIHAVGDRAARFAQGDQLGLEVGEQGAQGREVGGGELRVRGQGVGAATGGGCGAGVVGGGEGVGGEEGQRGGGREIAGGGHLFVGRGHRR